MTDSSTVVKAAGCRTCPRGATGFRCIASPNPTSTARVLWVYSQPEPLDIVAATPGVSGPTYSVMRTALNGLYQEDPTRRDHKIRVTYAAQCVPEYECEKPSPTVLRHCLPLFQQVRAQTAPQLYVAFGPVVLKQFGVTDKWSDVRGRILEPADTGLDAPLLVTFSEQAITTAAGLFGTFMQDLRNGYARISAGGSVDTTLAELTSRYMLPTTLEGAHAMLDAIDATPLREVLSVDTETTSLRPEKAGTKIIAFPLSWDVGVAGTLLYEHPFAPAEYLSGLPEIDKRLRSLFRTSRPKVFHGAKFDLKWMVQKYGMEVNNVAWCTLTGEHLLDEDKKGNYGLKALTTVYLPKFCGYEDRLFDRLLATDADNIAIADSKLSTLDEDDAEYAEELEAFKEAHTAYLADKARWDLEAVEYMAAQDAYAAALQVWEAIPARPPRPRKPAPPTGPDATDADFAAYPAQLQAYETALEAYQSWQGAPKPKKPARPAPLRKPPKLPKDPRSKKEQNYATDAGFEKVPLEELQLYGAVDADVTRRLCSIQLQRLANEGSKCRGLMKTHAIPASRVLGEVEYFGVKIDQNHIEVLQKGLDKVVQETRAEAEAMAGEGVNINSGPQMAQLLYDNGWTHPDGTRVPAVRCVGFTKKGARSTNVAALSPYLKYDDVYVPGQEKPDRVPRRESLFLDRYFLHRKAVKARDTFLRNLRVLSKRDGIIHTSFHINGTGTGRLSSSDMNLQNIPKKLAGYNLKALFIPDDDSHLFVNVDWKGAEVRVFTAYAKDAALIKALNDGLDMHSFFASKVFGRPYEHYDQRDNLGPEHSLEYAALLNKERTQIKRVVFGIFYGAGPKKIAEQVNITEERGKELIELLFTMFPAIRDYIDGVKYEVAANGYVETLFGRRRRFPLQATSRHRGRAERQACNFKIQSTSSDIVISQLIEMHEAIHSDRTWPEWGIHKPLHTYGVRILLTVHDSIGFQWPKALADALEPWVLHFCQDRIREKFLWLPVPFAVDIEVGPNYGELISLKKYRANLAPDPTQYGADDVESEIQQALREDAFSASAA